MPTADATLLPPPFPSEQERGSARRLDDVGVETVLEAMIEQKRRSSRPSFPAIELPPDDAEDEESQPSAGRSPRSATTSRTSQVFLKAR